MTLNSSLFHPFQSAPKAATQVEKTTENLRIIRTYPNPTDSQLTVEWEPQATGVELLWSDTQGKVLQRSQLEPCAQQHTLNVAQWPAGWYTLEWRGGGKRESLRVMKK